MNICIGWQYNILLWLYFSTSTWSSGRNWNQRKDNQSKSSTQVFTVWTSHKGTQQSFYLSQESEKANIVDKISKFFNKITMKYKFWVVAVFLLTQIYNEYDSHIINMIQMISIPKTCKYENFEIDFTCTCISTLWIEIFQHAWPVVPEVMGCVACYHLVILVIKFKSSMFFILSTRECSPDSSICASRKWNSFFS